VSTVHRSAGTTSHHPATGKSRLSARPPANADVAERVYEELGALAELMPQRYREVFCFRWGLHGQFPHLTSQAATKFEIPNGTAEGMLTRCLWNIARHAHYNEVPAIRELLGDDQARWAEQAWQHAERRWGNNDAQFAETVLLLAVAGIDVPEAHQAARQHMINIGIARSNKWGRPLTEQERADRAGLAVDRILKQVIWPSNPARLRDLSAFTTQRPLPSWAPEKSGVFHSEKLGRPVQFDSTLELVIQRQLDTDPRIVSYQEQPLKIPYTLDGYEHWYTPDLIALLDDDDDDERCSRAFIIEAKPLEHLGVFSNWMKWASLARHCQQHGLGFWVGSPERSLIEHCSMLPDPEKHELITGEVKNGPVTGADYTALRHLVGYEQLGLTATVELLDWRTDRGHIKPAEGVDRDEAKQFWALINKRESTLPERTESGDSLTKSLRC
jgi:hypothetical protein